MSAREAFDYWDQLSRTRALADDESIALEAAMRAVDYNSPRDDFWTEAEDEILRRERFKGTIYKVIGAMVGRSARAVAGRRRLLIAQGRFYARELAA